MDHSLESRKSESRKCFDFSIDNLLKIETKRRKLLPEFDSQNQNNCSFSVNVELSEEEQEHETKTLSWLNCTRFNPPKITRSRKRGGCGGQQERRPGRGPRIPFSPGQISLLEETFSTTRYLSSDSITRLASALNLSNDRVKIWFQNRRARFKREKTAWSGSSSPTPTFPNCKNTSTSQNSIIHLPTILPFWVGGTSASPNFTILPQLRNHLNMVQA